MEITPIRTEADYDGALARAEKLWDAAPGTPDADALDLLITLIERYEEKHHAIPLPDPIEALEFYMEARGLTRRDMEQYIGSRGRVAEILNRRRHLTMEMVRKLNSQLGIPSDVLIQPYKLIHGNTRIAVAS